MSRAVMKYGVGVGLVFARYAFVGCQHPIHPLPHRAALKWASFVNHGCIFLVTEHRDIMLATPAPQRLHWNMVPPRNPSQFGY
jgi:hypothetical protein